MNEFQIIFMLIVTSVCLVVLLGALVYQENLAIRVLAIVASILIVVVQTLVLWSIDMRFGIGYVLVAIGLYGLYQAFSSRTTWTQMSAWPIVHGIVGTGSLVTLMVLVYHWLGAIKG